MAKPTVPNLLEDAAATYAARHTVYGDNYKHYGQVMMGLFHEGLVINSEADWVRLGLIHNIVTKLTRYAQNIKKGGHKDSAHDATVYCAMLEEVTDAE